jgi:dTDP-4-dehydrorhamnose 3,5-epimerase
VHGIDVDFVQDNASFSRLPRTIRGLHFQRPPAAQAKLVRVVSGAVLDVAVDLRRDSSSFGRYVSALLTAKGGEQLFVPIGFAHGFCVTSEMADVMYKCDAYYDESIERGIKYDDPEVGIQWPDVELIPSQRDATAPLLSEVEDELPFRYGG